MYNSLENALIGCTVYRPQYTVYGLWFMVYGLPFTAYCLLPTAYRLPPTNIKNKKTCRQDDDMFFLFFVGGQLIKSNLYHSLFFHYE